MLKKIKHLILTSLILVICLGNTVVHAAELPKESSGITFTEEMKNKERDKYNYLIALHLTGNTANIDEYTPDSVLLTAKRNDSSTIFNASFSKTENGYVSYTYADKGNYTIQGMGLTINGQDSYSVNCVTSFSVKEDCQIIDIEVTDVYNKDKIEQIEYETEYNVPAPFPADMKAGGGNNTTYAAVCFKLTGVDAYTTPIIIELYDIEEKQLITKTLSKTENGYALFYYANIGHSYCLKSAYTTENSTTVNLPHNESERYIITADWEIFEMEISDKWTESVSEEEIEYETVSEEAPEESVPEEPSDSNFSLYKAAGVIIITFMLIFATAFCIRINKNQ